VTRVAVQAGAAWVRVATEGQLLAALPADAVDVATVLDGLFDGPVDEVLVVHPGGSPTTGTGATIRACVVRAVPTAVAALAEHAARTATPVGDAVVVDVGHRGTEVARVTAGRVVGARHVPVGGERLDAVAVTHLARDGPPVPAADARRAREALSLLPALPAGDVGTARVVPSAALHTALAVALSPVVEAVRAVVASAAPGASPPVLLVGGVARAPLLAEVLDAAGIADVRVAAQPDTAAVTGALRLPTGGWPTTGGTTGGARPAGATSTPRWLPPVPRPRRSRRVLGVLATAAALVGLFVAGIAVPAPTRASPAVGALVQYGYAVDLPAGWAHTGGLPERRRSLLTPLAAPDGSDLISVERTPLGYDADAEPTRARTELRARFAAAVAAGAPLSGFDDDARYAGRAVVVYQEAGRTSGADVDWYVVLDGDAQLSVGCRHTPAGTDAVRAACVTVVGSLRRAA
jgi:type VII secretion-associated protein (TIGR03931 family)